MIPISKPYFDENDILKYAHDALDSTWVSSTGKYIQETTDRLKDITGVEYVLLTNSGTSAMHLVSKCLQKFKGGQSVIVPDNVYVAAWNAFLFDNYYFISPVKSDLRTWNFDLESVIEKASGGNDAVLFVHNLGNIIPISYMREKLPHTTFVEDNCEGFHSGYALHKESFCGAVSFYGNKIVTSGEGGAFLCHDEEVYEYAKKLLGQGQTSERFIHDTLGYNYRMTNVQAAILYGQLEYIDIIEDMRKGVFDMYTELLKDSPVIPQKFTVHSRWMYGVRIPSNKSYKVAREYFNDAGIETRPMFYPMSYHKHLKVYANEINESNSVTLNNEVILLPTYPTISFKDNKYIADTLNRYVEQLDLL